MPSIHLNKTHPGLYKAVIGIALTLLSIGGLILHSALVIPPRFPILAWGFIVSFFAVAGTLLYGVFAARYTFVRNGLILALALIGFLALVFAATIGLTLNKEQTIRLAWLFPPWGGLAWWIYTCIAEPPSNPLNEKPE